MPTNPFRFDEPRLLLEQVKLVMAVERNGLFAAVAIGFVVTCFLFDANNGLKLSLWWCWVALSHLYGAWLIHRTLNSSPKQEHAIALAKSLVIGNVLMGITWGTLAWITIDGESILNSIIVIGLLASLLVGIMPTFSPVFSVYAFACTTITITVVTKLFLLEESLYVNLGIFIAVMGFIFIGIARDMNINTTKNIHLQLDKSDLITQLEQETNNVRKAQQAAEHANLAKTKFLAAASHDIRQPIHALGLFLEVLDRSTLSTYQQQVLNNAKAAFSASADMLNTLLDFSRIEAGVVDVQKRQFYLQPLLNKLENEMAPQANNKNLFYRSRETRALVESDPVILELILRNLISNAIRYTNNGGILLGCRVRKEYTSLEIWDTGIGISPDHQDDIFREFYQLGNTERDRRKGLGLGLAIVRGFANSLGHPLSFSSTLKRGSVFRIHLPNTNTIPTANADDLQPAEIQLLNAKILLVDDDVSVRQGTMDLLVSWGCECSTADSFDEALAFLQTNKPDLIISDYRLREGHTGTDVIRLLRKQSGYDLPALIITGDTAPDRLADAHSSGLPLLSKPVSPQILYSTITKQLGKSRSNI